MKYFFIAFTALVVCCILFVSCESQEQKEERLAKQYCSSCHLFTQPGLLNKKNWEENVLPQMAFRMGFAEMKVMSALSPEDLEVILHSIPSTPMVTEEEWAAIKNYFLTHAPDSIIPAPHKETNHLTLFDTVSIISPSISALVTLIKTDSIEKKTWIGTRSSKLFQLNSSLSIEDSLNLTSPASDIIFQNNNNQIISVMGIMDPNDQSKGALQSLSVSNHSATTFIDSLKRPVYFEKADLNGDQLDDYLICAFGNYTGALLAYENLGNGNFKKHMLLNQPGARKTIVKDVDNDGLKDIIVMLSQGDEQISLLRNSGNFNFKINSLLRFPPVYGSSFFDLADFNKDGHFDILYSNGDNADYSTILKPYHGVHIYLNDGKNQFKESWSYPMHGASQVLARDFDGDGDLDIAAISFFPDFNYPEEGFIYFENTGKKFIAQTTPTAASGRWLVMNATDLDSDGDCDLLLGALNFNNGVPAPVHDKWKKKTVSLLLLRNKRNQ